MIILGTDNDKNVATFESEFCLRILYRFGPTLDGDDYRSSVGPDANLSNGLANHR
jgi:hypothetical protein